MDEPRSVSVREACAEVEAGTALLVDVRRPDEWAATGLPKGAIGITMEDPAFLDRLEQATGGDASRRILLTCRSGARSGSVQRALIDLGYTNTANVRGGMVGSGPDEGWGPAGLPIERWQG
jgi:rhodanese-related sulfurtransferase